MRKGGGDERKGGGDGDERKGGSEGDEERRWKFVGVSKNTKLILLNTVFGFIFSTWQSSVY